LVTQKTELRTQNTHHEHSVDALDLREVRIQWDVTAVAQDAVEALQSQWRQVIWEPEERQAYGVALPLHQLRVRAIRGGLVPLVVAVSVPQLAVTKINIPIRLMPNISLFPP